MLPAVAQPTKTTRAAHWREKTKVKTRWTGPVQQHSYDMLQPHIVNHPGALCMLAQWNNHAFFFF